MKGKLLVVTGFSGAGKDAIIDTLVEKKTSFRRLITCADRDPRPGEIHGVHYYFVKSGEMDRMHREGELVEKPLLYGTSRKATPKKEFKKIITEGASLIWRIESSLASHVASGKFFEEQFSEDECLILKESTIVTFITADKNDLVLRRRKRDGSKYNPNEFAKRDEQDALILKKYGHHFKNIIENKEGKIEKAVEKIMKLLEDG
jgi:guanylate kinase